MEERKLDFENNKKTNVSEEFLEMLDASLTQMPSTGERDKEYE